MRQHSAQDTLARNLRRLRVARRSSLSELATATGIGKATLSAIENARGNPTVDTLATLARALEVDAGELLAGTSDDELTLVRASERDPAEGVRVAGAELRHASFEAGASVEAGALAPGTRLHVIVTRGTLMAGPAERPVELGRGDYLSFPADRPHVFTTARRGAEAVVLAEGD